MNLATYTLLGALVGGLIGAAILSLGIVVGWHAAAQEPALVEHCGAELPPMPQAAPRIKEAQI